MKELIPVINKIQKIFSTIDSEMLELPQIVAVGTQSSGKSSLIESIVGFDFLPRGTGMITRRPLIIQLISHSKSQFDTCAEFAHKNQIFTDFKLVHDEIINETNRILSDLKDVSNLPIILKLYSLNFVNLTLVDLPGLTRIPIGKQPLDIEKKIEDLTLSFINNKNSIILAVIPANIDIATSEALRMSRLVDPQGLRTLVVLTKLDLMDKGTSAFEILSGKIINVKLGIIGVLNRSQQDIDNNKSITHVRDFEKKFFESNYPDIINFGIDFLTKRLNNILLEHIKTCLPDLKNRVRILTEKYKIIVDSYCAPSDKKYTLILLINNFFNIFNEIIRGSFKSLKTSELHGGSRIYYIFHRIYCKKIEEINPLDGITTNDILTAILNCRGIKSDLFFPEKAFEFLVKKQILKLEAPSLECIFLVCEEMYKILAQALETTEFKIFSNLKNLIERITRQIIIEESEPTKLMIKNLIKSEISYINTDHPDFNYNFSAMDYDFAELNINTDYDVNTSSVSNVENFKSTRDNARSRILESLIKSYIKIINHKFQDSVPKFINCFLIEKSLERIPVELVEKLINNDVDEILSESAEIMARKEKDLKTYQALSEASDIIFELKDFKL